MDREPILVGYDGSSTARAAVEWAFDEARRWSCGVRLVEVFEWPVRVGPATTRPETWPRTEAYRDAERALDHALSVFADSNPDVRVDGLVVEGPPAAMLSDLSTGARMVVVGDRGRGGFAGLLLGSVAAAVVTHAAGAVAVIRGGAAGQAGSGPVVVGVDDSPEARAAVSAAFVEAAARDSGVVAVRAWQPPRAWHGVGPLRYDDAVSDLESAERTVLTAVLEDDRRANPTVTVTARVPQTDPVRALADASRDAQLVVVGSGGRSGFRGARLGSTVRQLLRHMRCPVLVVRGPAERRAGTESAGRSQTSARTKPMATPATGEAPAK